MLLGPKSCHVKIVIPYQQVSYLCRFPENINQTENLEGTCLLTDLLTKEIFSNGSRLK